MNIFKTFTLKWWQASLFKLSLLSFGLMVGAAWAGVFNPLRVTLLLPVFILTTVYVTWVWWKQ